MSINYYLGQLIGRFGYSVVRTHRLPTSTLNMLKHFMEYAMEKHAVDNEFVILQIGAFDGSYMDALSEILAKSGHYRAILVEPQPTPFKKLQQKYSNRSDIVTVNAAISDSTGIATLYVDKAQSTPLASLNRDHARHLNRGKPLKVPCMTLSDLAVSVGVTRLDAVIVDAEGYDLKILQLLFETTSFRPMVIQCEFFSLNSHDRQRLATLLSDYGYKYVDVGIDTLALSRDFI